jgi:N-hydroxyarylamine O-acetyltransferase
MNLDAYLARIGLSERPKPDAEGLFALQRAQRLHIPFESIDIHLGRGISVDPDAVFDKLVTRRRGGYCFEQNQLLGRALSALGFETRPVLGRVWLFKPESAPPRTHTLQLVTINGTDWIADAGFGASYCPPMELTPDVDVTGPDGGVHRLVHDAEYGWMLERMGSTAFQSQFSFTTDRIVDTDLTMSNHWSCTWPTARFVQHVVANICLPQGSASLMGLTYSCTNGQETVSTTITSPRMLQMRLSLIFGIDLTLDEVKALGLFGDNA